MTRPRRPGIRVPWDIPIEDFGFCLCDGDFGDLALASGVGSAERAIGVVTVDDLELAGAFDQAAPSYYRMVSRNPPITASSLLRPMRSPNVLPVRRSPSCFSILAADP